MELNSILERLKSEGFRITEQRKHLLCHLLKQEGPFSGEAVYEELKVYDIGRATVFRTLRLLLHLGVLTRDHFDGSCQEYKLARRSPLETPHQDRIVCRSCGEESFLDECPMKQEVTRIAKRSGFRLEEGHHELYGICERCEKSGSNRFDQEES